MNKKILITSIIAGAVLIGVSFTSVIGYRSVASDVKASPLFNIRSSRAIDEESEELSCEYVGNGNGINLFIPNRDDKIELIIKVLEKIQVMDDVTFNRYFNLAIYRLQQNNELKDLNVDEIIITFYKLRDNPDIINGNYNRRGDTYLDTPSLCWFPGCIFFGILYFVTIWTLILLVLFLFSVDGDCRPISLGPLSCNCYHMS